MSNNAVHTNIKIYGREVFIETTGDYEKDMKIIEALKEAIKAYLAKAN